MIITYAALLSDDSWWGPLIVNYLHDPWGTITSLLITPLRAWLASRGRAAAPLALVLVLGVLRVAGRRWQQARMVRGARLVAVQTPPTVDESSAGAFWANLAGMLRPAWLRWLAGQPHMAFELSATRHGLRHDVWVPRHFPVETAERGIEAAWPGARTTTSHPAPPALPDSGTDTITVTGQLRLGRTEALPLRTDHDTDPIRPLLAALGDLHAGEHALVQILARPVTGRRAARARRRGRALAAGATPHRVGRFLDLITPGKPPRPSLDHQSRLEHSRQDQAILDKVSGPLFETRLRYALTAGISHEKTRAQRAIIRGRLRRRAHALAGSFAVVSGHNYYRRRRLVWRPDRVINQRRLGGGDVLGVDELAAIAHLPFDEDAPGLRRAGARAVPPPPDTPAAGPEVKPLGLSDATTRPVGLRVADAREHLHVLGATGSGKSELLARMILADADAGRGVIVVDPKGDLVTDVLSRLPARLGENVVLFDADSATRPPCVNPLEGEDPARTVDNLVSIFSNVYHRSWGPRTDDLLRAGLITLTGLGGTPLISDLQHLLENPEFRHVALQPIHDEVLQGFWDYYERLSDAERNKVTAPLGNKLRQLLLRPFVRAAVSGGPSTVDFDQILDGGICLVRISSDALGMDTAQLLGSIVVARTWQAATHRAGTPQHRRADASLYLDEAQHFLHLPYALEDMLAQARGYRLAITLAHQYLGQLPTTLEEGISTNARSKVFFNSSPEDARHLARHTHPRLGEHDLSHLGAFHAAARLVAHGEQTPAFTLVTEKLPPPIPGRAKRIRRAAAIHNQSAPPAHTARPSTPEAHQQPGPDPRRTA